MGSDGTPTTHDVVIVGSGPAGYTAAVYTARAGLRPLVLEGFQRGGELMTTTDVENFPGFPAGVQGPDLMEAMREQAQRFGADLRTADAEAITLGTLGGAHTVTSGDDVHHARAVILAMGAQPRYLGVPGESEYLGRGVSACATCDGYFFRDKDVVVVGGGDSAMEEALFLGRLARHVILVHRRQEFRASRIMLERVLAADNITVRTDARIGAVVGGSSVDAVVVEDTRTGDPSTLPVSGVFVSIGHDPRSGLVAGQVDLGPEGHVLVRHPSTATSVPGVFAAGDLVDTTYRQAITAAGSGCAAALDVERWLRDQAPTTGTPDAVPVAVPVP